MKSLFDVRDSDELAPHDIPGSRFTLEWNRDIFRYPVLRDRRTKVDCQEATERMYANFAGAETTAATAHRMAAWVVKNYPSEAA